MGVINISSTSFFSSGLSNFTIPSEEILSMLSFPCTCVKGSLKKARLSDIDAIQLRKDIAKYQDFIYVSDIKPPDPYRIKTVQSAILKLKRKSEDFPATSILNDILGIRMRVAEYPSLISIPDYLRYVDLTQPKENDSGYRGIHLYYRKDNYHYPIEIQLWSDADYEINGILHEFVYKQLSNQVGAKLREIAATPGLRTRYYLLHCLEDILNEQ